MGRKLTYSRRVFEAADEASARRIILTPEFGQNTDERWERETPYLVDLIGEQLQPRKGGLLIDYGCGIGRLSKALIERFGVRVLGVDLSERMRVLAPDYVGSQLFSVVSPYMLHSLAQKGLRADGALSVWVLQHCAVPSEDIALLHRSIAPGGEVFVVNAKRRVVPTAEGVWGDDGLDVRALLSEAFAPVAEGSLAPPAVPDGLETTTFWGAYARRLG